MVYIEKFGVKDISLALFDCISNDNTENVIVCDTQEDYYQIFEELVEAHDYAPITGVSCMDYASGLISFNNGSALLFTVGYRAQEGNSEVDNESREPPETLNSFLNKFNVL